MPDNKEKIFKSKYKGKTKTIKDSFESYYLSQKDEDPVSRDEYIEICRAFNRLIMQKVLDGHVVTLPEKLGSLKVLGTKEKIQLDEEGKIKGLSPNWAKTKEFWESNPEAKKERKLIYNTNEHSSGIRYRFLWSKQGSLVRNKTIYVLRITREFRRKLSSKIFSGQEYESKDIPLKE